MGEGEAYLANTAVVAVAAILGRIPAMEEYAEHAGLTMATKHPSPSAV